jgi:hypothetical protein
MHLILSATSNEVITGSECQGKSFDPARIGMVNPGLEPASGMNLITDMPKLNGPQVSTIGFPSSFFSAEPQRLRGMQAEMG